MFTATPLDPHDQGRRLDPSGILRLRHLSTHLLPVSSTVTLSTHPVVSYRHFLRQKLCLFYGYLVVFNQLTSTTKRNNHHCVNGTRPVYKIGPKGTLGILNSLSTGFTSQVGPGYLSKGNTLRLSGSTHSFGQKLNTHNTKNFESISSCFFF